MAHHGFPTPFLGMVALMVSWLGESSPGRDTCGFWVLFEPATIHESWDGGNMVASGS